MQTVDLIIDPLREFYHLHHEQMYDMLCGIMMVFFAIVAILDRAPKIKEEPLSPSLQSNDW
jgi:hypothetical protein